MRSQGTRAPSKYVYHTHDATRGAVVAVYEVVKRKEAEKRAARRVEEPAEGSFAATLKQEWEKKRKVQNEQSSG